MYPQHILTIYVLSLTNQCSNLGHSNLESCLYVVHLVQNTLNSFIFQNTWMQIIPVFKESHNVWFQTIRISELKDSCWIKWISKHIFKCWGWQYRKDRFWRLIHFISSLSCLWTLTIPRMTLCSIHSDITCTMPQGHIP